MVYRACTPKYGHRRRPHVSPIAPVEGNAVSYPQIPDETFAAGVLGQGVGVKPKEGAVIAPCDGVISSVAETGHAVGHTGVSGKEFLIHLGGIQSKWCVSSCLCPFLSKDLLVPYCCSWPTTTSFYQKVFFPYMIFYSPQQN